MLKKQIFHELFSHYNGVERDEGVRFGCLILFLSSVDELKIKVQELFYCHQLISAWNVLWLIWICIVKILLTIHNRVKRTSHLSINKTILYTNKRLQQLRGDLQIWCLQDSQHHRLARVHIARWFKLEQKKESLQSKFAWGSWVERGLFGVVYFCVKEGGGEDNSNITLGAFWPNGFPIQVLHL